MGIYLVTSCNQKSLMSFGARLLLKKHTSQHVSPIFVILFFKVKIPVEILLRFILPLMQPYIIDFTSKTSALSDEAIRLLSHIMSVSPWKRQVIAADNF